MTVGPEERGPLSSRRPHRGVVAAFDADRGLGTVTSDAGRQLPFHCTAIADGTRRIAVGTVVVFVVGSGPLGQVEARGILPEGPTA